MRKRSLGTTGLSVSELSVGTWGLSGDGYGVIAEGEAEKVISRALAMGINLFETATSYGHGAMESILGKCLEEKDAIVVTKIGSDRKADPARKHFDADFLKAEVEASKKRLGDRVKLIALLHNPSASATKGGACETMRELCDNNVLTSWGVSVGDEDVARAALSEKAPILSFAHNILQVQPLRALEKQLAEHKVGVLAHTVLSYGLLAGRWPPTKQFRYGDHRAERWPEGTLRGRVRHLDAIRPLVSGEVTTMRSAAVRFVLQNEVLSSAVLGPRSTAQLDQLVRESKSEPPYLSAPKLDALEKRLANLEVPR